MRCMAQGFEAWFEERGKWKGKGKEAPIIRLVIASLREIPTDLIVIARRGTRLGGGWQRKVEGSVFRA